MGMSQPHGRDSYQSFPMSVMSQTERENCEPMDSGRLPFVWWL